uniref:Peptidase C13 n=1 Tax=Phenylobacterium glaciei TaxID=2803784 RepID=A0A974P663_9CAUL|nr:peptidase C13 [Phenylobacterium glaciei]
MGARRGFLGVLIVLLLGWTAPAFAATGPFSDWAAVVVAGDWHAHSGGPSEAFDNARRDVSQELERIGFDKANLRQLSVRPERYKDVKAGKSSPKAIYEALTEIAPKAQGGCLVYFSSHGAPQGAGGPEHPTPPLLGAILDRTCGQRPTVVVISACFSGVFIPDLAQPNRMILTAARPDRTSFGCGEANKYPFFDECFLQSSSAAHDFPSLAKEVQACVAAREKKEGMTPPSEPQVWIGPQLRPMLPLYPFPVGPPPKG